MIFGKDGTLPYQDLLEIISHNKNNLPKILQNDSQIRYLGLKKENIIKITRNNEMVGYEIIYKMVK